MFFLAEVFKELEDLASPKKTPHINNYELMRAVGRCKDKVRSLLGSQIKLEEEKQIEEAIK